MVGKRLVNTGGAVAAFDPLQNFETVTYTGNGGTQKITGYIRKGAAFNGSSSEIEVSSNVLNINTISISAWINLSTTSGFQQIVSNYSSSNTGWGLRINDGGYLSYNTAVGVITSSTVLSTNTWYHVALTIDSSGNSTKLYINGSEDSSTTYTAPTYGAGNTNFHIGSLGNINVQYFNGKIDQVRIFDKALSSGEVTTLYGETYASSTKSTTDIFGDGSGVALYELDEDAGDTGTPIDRGQSAVFNGSNSYITASVPNSVIDSMDSVSLWFNLNSLSSVNSLLNIGRISSNGSALRIRVSSTGSTPSQKVRFIIHNSSNTAESIFSTTTISANTWYHVAAVWTGSQWEMYLNGVNEANSSSTTSRVAAAGNEIYIGENDSLYNPLNGKVDQIRIYSSALSSSDITNLYNESSIPTSNLIAHYKLDGDATDEQGSYDGTPTNVTYSDEVAGIYYNGTPTNVNFLGMAFQPDLVWLKDRDNTNHHTLFDSIRGENSILYPDLPNAIGTGEGFGSFDSNGFTLDTGYTRQNANGVDYVAWCWKAGGAAVSNTDGSITSQVSANQDAGFSIVKYTGNGTDGASVGHGLNAAPELIIYKWTTAANNWIVLTTAIDGSADYLFLNTTAAKGDYPSSYIPTDTLFYNNTSSTNDIIAYCFHSVDGYQKVGSYTGTGTSQTISVGFQPRFVMIKRATGGSLNGWVMSDYQRGAGINLFANASQAEVDESAYGPTSFTSDGFTLAQNGGNTNVSGSTYIYLAIA
jgi:hypothetical protein